MAREQSLFLSTRTPTCPPGLIERAQLYPKPRIAIAGAGGISSMAAAKDATLLDIMIPIFIGKKELIKSEATALDWDIDSFEIIDVDGEVQIGLTAAKICGDGGADILMKDQIHSDIFIKSALDKSSGLRTGRRLIHIFHISHPDGGRPILISDAAVNILPGSKTRKEIAREIVRVLRIIGTQNPKVAVLSATEVPNPAMASSIEARELVEWCSDNIKGAEFSGPLALDTILSCQSSKIKGIEGDQVAGQADAIIVPDIVSGNTLFKALVYLSAGCAAGVVTGAKVPLLLTSRADPPAARLASIALAAQICGNTQINN